ncbi:hypothetical protein [Paenibacillus sp. NAIST15-1]|uniref:hypothetical protein n=1 Tax=Paenibacillus sp. NAIST15-1 TaxID=1605994 RepID=UPI00086DDAD7|nr:hypothetical protein [Paenibacillus sp. NAIST15-1]GAV11491.1 hypothetical protein PBN151_1420 [Paenibacillus sp. NAIST15-1]
MYYSLQYVTDSIYELKVKKEELTKWISQYDKGLSEAYHRVELEEYDTQSSVSFVKELQDLTRKRRKVKFELIQVNTLIQELNNAKQKLESKEFKYFYNNDNYKEYIYD